MDFENGLIILSSDNSLNDILNNNQKINNINFKNKSTTTIDNLPTADGSMDRIITIEQAFTDEQLKNIFKLLKPGSGLSIIKTNKISNLSFLLKSNGFLVDNQEEFIVAKKPEYEVGSAVNISKKVWSLAADDINDGELIDDDELLDDNDKARPKDEDLKVCASTKQRKACANCTCGLKEELEKEEIEKIRANTQNVKSSCGNCYLGDAFRCESCPYRGLPAFKPGEKVVIDTLTDDL